LPTTDLRILAAGSLRAFLTEHAAAEGGAYELMFGPAGLLRERIESGEACDLFLSANMTHPRALAARAGAMAIPFARNRLVAVARGEVGLRPNNFLERLVAPETRLGTSTPVVDPSGDYAVTMFAKAETLHTGAGEALRRKARHLVGGRDPAVVPEGRNAVAHFLTEGAADIFLSYWSGARSLAGAFDVVDPPPELMVIADYGLLVMAPATARGTAAAAFADSLLAERGQARLVAHGFEKKGSTSS